MYRAMPGSWANVLAGKDISGKDMSNYDLTDINLEGSVCRECSFRGSMLAWANLRSADFTDADFTDAILSESDFRGSTLTRADLTGAYLKPIIADSEQFSDCIGVELSMLLQSWGSRKTGVK
ncbi:pentapeptide repeat-containing protein [Corynebacterium breve]|uniref:Pentapeptide repeat-containing protein n=1 Tax=Corynebacterium breve TaxID=3049799 RepID=A0ABY8VHS0_9CORY|nr:pentapeptide repeat-containing protein [Corynebacterium breve]WIM67803.1 pentapeptide repeat-containing protein [Corynebacterium breve]